MCEERQRETETETERERDRVPSIVFTVVYLTSARLHVEPADHGEDGVHVGHGGDLLVEPPEQVRRQCGVRVVVCTRMERVVRVDRSHRVLGCYRHPATERQARLESDVADLFDHIRARLPGTDKHHPLPRVWGRVRVVA